MRREVDAKRIQDFLRALGAKAENDLRIYLTGGATAVLHGWRETTIGVDLKMEPERDEIFRAIPRLKEVDAIEPRLYRYPAIAAESFRRAVAEVVKNAAKES